MLLKIFPSHKSDHEVRSQRQIKSNSSTCLRNPFFPYSENITLNNLAKTWLESTTAFWEIVFAIPVICDSCQTCNIQNHTRVHRPRRRFMGVMRNGRAFMAKHSCAHHSPKLGSFSWLLLHKNSTFKWTQQYRANISVLFCYQMLWIIILGMTCIYLSSEPESELGTSLYNNFQFSSDSQWICILC